MKTPRAFTVDPDGAVRMRLRTLVAFIVAIAAAAAWAVRQDHRIEDLESDTARLREWTKSLQEQVRELERR